jgi:hypothetical protein
LGRPQEPAIRPAGQEHPGLRSQPFIRPAQPKPQGLQHRPNVEKTSVKPRVFFQPHPVLQKNRVKPPAAKTQPLPGKKNTPKDPEKKKFKPKF